MGKDRNIWEGEATAESAFVSVMQVPFFILFFFSCVKAKSGGK